MTKFTDLGDVEKDFKKFVGDTHKGLAIGLFEDMREDSRNVGLEFGSPVASGRFSASIRLAIGETDAVLGATPDVPKDESYVWPGPRTIKLRPVAEFFASVARFKTGDKIYVGNTLDYAPDIEGGYSRKTPFGVAAVTLARFKSNARARIAELTAPFRAMGGPR